MNSFPTTGKNDMNGMKDKWFFRLLKGAGIGLCAAMTASVFSCTDPAASSPEISLEAIPVGSMAVIRVDDPSALGQTLESNPCREVFDSLDLTRRLDESLQLLARICGREKADRPVTIAASKVGARDISLLLVCDAGGRTLTTAFGADTLTQVQSYEKTEITTLKTPSGEYCYYTRGDALILSDNRLYLEQSILQGASDGVCLSDDRSFARSFPVLLGGKKASAALRLPEISRYAKSFLGVETHLLGELSPWAAVELRADSTSLRAEGIFCTDDSTASLASVLAGQKVKDLTLDNRFPSDTYRYLYLGVADWEKYFTDYILYLKASSQFHLYNQAARTYGQLPEGEPWRFFLPWAGTGLAVVQTVGEPVPSVLIATTDAQAAAQALETIADSAVVRPEKYRNTTIVPIGCKNILYDLVTHAAPRQGAAFAVVAGDVVVFSPSEAALKKILDDIRLGTTLQTIEGYVKQKSQLATSTQLLALIRGDLWSEQVAGTAQEKRRQGKALDAVEKYVRAQSKRFENLRYNFLQVSATGGTAFLNIRMAWDDAAARQAVKEWSFALDAPAATAPLAFPNHRNGRYDVLIQDTEGTLYLISDKGSLFWKKKLGATITSPIVVCDLYDNHKYQMAFWTGKKFHVIDRLGNYVTAADKVARAKKLKAPTPQATVVSTNEIGYQLRSGSMRKVKTPQSPLSSVVYVPSVDALVYRLADGKVYAIHPDGKTIQGFPVMAEKDFTAQDFGRDHRLGIAALSPEGVITFYRLPQDENK